MNPIREILILICLLVHTISYAGIEVKASTTTGFGKLAVVQNSDTLDTSLWFNSKKLSDLVGGYYHFDSQIKYKNQHIILLSRNDGGSGTPFSDCNLIVLQNHKAEFIELEDCIFDSDGFKPRLKLKNNKVYAYLGFFDNKKHAIEYDGKYASVISWRKNAPKKMKESSCKELFTLKNEFCRFAKGMEVNEGMWLERAFYSYDNGDVQGFNKDEFNKICNSGDYIYISYKELKKRACSTK